MCVCVFVCVCVCVCVCKQYYKFQFIGNDKTCIQIHVYRDDNVCDVSMPHIIITYFTNCLENINNNQVRLR